MELPGRCHPACFGCTQGARGCPEPLSCERSPPALQSLPVPVVSVAMEWFGALERLPGWRGGAPQQGWSGWAQGMARDCRGYRLYSLEVLKP